MKLAEWARQQGITYQTAWKWFKQGKMPVPCFQTPSGAIMVGSPEPTMTETATGVALYARVSSRDQSDDLRRQTERLRQFAAARGIIVSREVEEFGSGLNGRRPKLIKLLRDPTIGTIVVEHRDRLGRFGTDMVSAAMEAADRTLIVMNESEHRDDLVQDFVDLATSMCARIYGRRSARNRAERAVAAMQEVAP